MNTLISKRLKIARERACMTQAELAKLMGFNDRQTLTAIETEQRNMSADELLRAMQILNVDLDYFTDSYRLEGEGQFSWRTTENTEQSTVTQFEELAGRWISTYRRLGEKLNITTSPLETRLNIDVRCKFEEVRSIAESLSKEWELGDVPAQNLAAAMRENLNVLILNVDTPKEISGAACQIPGMNTILVNRNELEGRRHYTLAHECFHLLTWEQMPPEYTDTNSGKSGKAKRIEQLANNFASALLMPEPSLTTHWENRGEKDVHDWLNDAANVLMVTAQAVKWRVVHLGWFTFKDLSGINDDMLIANGRPENKQSKPQLFCSEFVSRLHAALTEGYLSVRRLAELLGLLIDDILALFVDYELSVPFEI